MGYVLDKSGTDGAECNRKMASWRRVAGAIRSLVSARDLHRECTRVLHETFLVPFLMYDSETMLWKERFRIKAMEMDNPRGLLGIICMLYFKVVISEGHDKPQLSLQVFVMLLMLIFLCRMEY